MSSKKEAPALEAFLGPEITRMKEIIAFVEANPEIGEEEGEELDDEYNELGMKILNFVLWGNKMGQRG